MSSATHLPRCSACLAIVRRQHPANSLATSLSLAIGILLVATASMPASAEESHNHFVGPPSRLQPRLTNEMGTPRALTIPQPTALANPLTRLQPLAARTQFDHIQIESSHIEPTQFVPDPADTIPELPLTLQPELPPTLQSELPLTPQPGLLEQPTTSEELASGDEAVEPMPCYIAPPLSRIGTNIAFPEGALPANVAAECAAVTGVVNDVRREYGWAQFDFHWSATCLCHRPLYFEEINAERYGYTVSNFFQPVISAGKFFFTIPALPYKMAVDRPHDCIYTLGQYRPGDCAPRRWNHIPLKVGAAIVEVGTIAGLILLIP